MAIRRAPFIVVPLLLASLILGPSTLAGLATGSLTVKIKPKDAKQDGARWRVDGGAWQKGGKTVDNLDAGDHEVSFKDATGWKTPKDKTVTINANKETVSSGKYKHANSIMFTLPGDVELEMIWIPGGTFQMGRYSGEANSNVIEDPQHSVIVPGFWMGRYEVTKSQWLALVALTPPWNGQPYVSADGDSPAVYMSYVHAQYFIDALNDHTDETFRLPSESEWEYACRAGTTTRYYWGDDSDLSQIGNYAWWKGNTGDAFEPYAHVVGLKLPNAFGLHDMSGNVWEWCEDWYHESYTGAPADGSVWLTQSGEVTGNWRVYRGGTWDSFEGYVCRSAYRGQGPPTSGSHGTGFRLVL